MAAKGATNMLGDIVWDQNTLAVLGVFSVPVIAIVAGCWATVERRKSDNELKQTMIERGMSVDDVERVLAAKSPKH